MDETVQNFLPPFRYDMFQPHSHEGRSRGTGYQFYRLVPRDVMESSSVLEIETRTASARPSLAARNALSISLGPSTSSR